MWPFDSITMQRPAALRRHRVQRVGERFPTDLLFTEFGPVADISGYGLRIRSGRGVKALVGQLRNLTIRWADFGISVKCQVVRVDRAPDGGIDVGVSFVGASARLRTVLEHLGQFGFPPGAVGSSANGAPGGSRRSKTPPPDHYQLLGLADSATAAEIRQAYHRLARKHHPDSSNDAASTRTFEALAEAYRTLRDSESRRHYDETRAATGSTP